MAHVHQAGTEWTVTPENWVKAAEICGTLVKRRIRRGVRTRCRHRPRSASRCPRCGGSDDCGRRHRLRHAFAKENAELQARLGREHAVISQFWPDQGPRKHTFPMRNAVMSGISRATVVVEASYTSGARMQARLAREHARPVVLLSSLVHEYEWAQEYAQRLGVYVVDHVSEVVDRLDSLYAPKLNVAI